MQLGGLENTDISQGETEVSYLPGRKLQGRKVSVLLFYGLFVPQGHSGCCSGQLSIFKHKALEQKMFMFSS